jgi:hypothetical protein
LTAPFERRERQRRAQSWNIEIARAFLGPPRRKTVTHAIFEGGWTVRLADGAWYNRKLAVGGYLTVKLVRLLSNDSHYKAAEYVIAWLRSHEGYGPCNGIVEDDDDGQGTDTANPDVARNLHLAHKFWELRQPIAGTVGYDWIERIRKLPGDYCDVDQVAFLPLHAARPGDCGVLFALYCHDRRIGFELNYIDPVTHDRPETRITP